MINSSERTSFREDLEVLEKMTKPKDLFRLANARRMALEQQPRRLPNFYWIMAAISSCFFIGFMLFPIESVTPNGVNQSVLNVESQISQNQEYVMADDADFYYWLDIYDE
jgi:hypothetical protein